MLYHEIIFSHESIVNNVKFFLIFFSFGNYFSLIFKSNGGPFVISFSVRELLPFLIYLILRFQLILLLYHECTINLGGGGVSLSNIDYFFCLYLSIVTCWWEIQESLLNILQFIFRFYLLI